MNNITERFNLQQQNWETHDKEEYNISFIQEMLKQTKTGGMIRIFVSKTNDHVFSNSSVVETISDCLENACSVEIMVNPITKQDIFSSGLLSRVAFYQTLNNVDVKIKRTRVGFTMSREGKNSAIDYITVNNSFLVVSSTGDDQQLKEYISCVNDPLALQSLNGLFDVEWEKAEEIELSSLLDNKGEV